MVQKGYIYRNFHLEETEDVSNNSIFFLLTVIILISI